MVGPAVARFDKPLQTNKRMNTTAAPATCQQVDIEDQRQPREQSSARVSAHHGQPRGADQCRQRRRRDGWQTLWAAVRWHARTPLLPRQRQPPLTSGTRWGPNVKWLGVLVEPDWACGGQTDESAVAEAVGGAVGGPHANPCGGHGLLILPMSFRMSPRFRHWVWHS